MPEENTDNSELVGVFTYDPYLSARLVEFAHIQGISSLSKRKSQEFQRATEFKHRDLPREKLLQILDGLDLMMPETTYVVANRENDLIRVRGINGAPNPITLRKKEILESPKLPIELKLHTDYT